MHDLKFALEPLFARQAGYKEADEYFSGTRAEYMPLRLRGLGSDEYRVNYCAPVVDAVLNRLEITGIESDTEAAQAVINRLWDSNEMTLEVEEIHRNTLAFGDSYALVWPDEDGEWLISYHSPISMQLFYKPENPRKKDFAVKSWLERGPLNQTVTRVNLYFADRIEKYQANGEANESSQYTLIDTVDNPFGEVPVFHFRTHRPYGKPEHFDAYGLQDAITKTMNTHMYTVDFLGAPQRFILTSAEAGGLEADDFDEGHPGRTNDDALKSDPGSVWNIPGATEAGEFKAADPENFLKPIREFVRAMASLTNTPLHYFERTGNVPSGEALRTAEAPLIKKTQDRIASFTATWKELIRFVLKAEGVAGVVAIKWAEIASLDPIAAQDMTSKKINNGMSRRQAWREQGYDEELIDKMLAERIEEDRMLGYDRAVRTATESTELGDITTDE